jgi:drug/metabolite transporter (DMT)-like permease
VVAFILSVIGSYFVSMIGFFTILLAPLAGMGIAEAVRFVVRRRRARNLPILVATAIFLGGILLLATNLIVNLLGSVQFGLASLLSLLWPVLYAILATSTAFYRLKGIRL